MPPPPPHRPRAVTLRRDPLLCRLAPRQAVERDDGRSKSKPKMRPTAWNAFLLVLNTPTWHRCTAEVFQKKKKEWVRKLLNWSGSGRRYFVGVLWDKPITLTAGNRWNVKPSNFSQPLAEPYVPAEVVGFCQKSLVEDAAATYLRSCSCVSLTATTWGKKWQSHTQAHKEACNQRRDHRPTS